MKKKKTENVSASFLHRYATHQNRWYALIIIALGLAIVIIDNTVLNVSIPYILRDLNASFSAIQWSISGYALTIATVLITIGRIGDLVGRKKMFLIGIIIFAIGSVIGSFAFESSMLIFGRGVIQALGAAITLTSALALLAQEFQGKERAIAFGIWGAVAGASATIGPLLGGYLTTTLSWRWSLRINVFVALIAIIGSVFIIESKPQKVKKFDWWGTLFSGIGLFCLVFAFIQGREYGWLTPVKPLSIMGIHWPSSIISIIPFFFITSAIFLSLFILREWQLEKKGLDPLLSISLFKKRDFSVGLSILAILAFTQFGIFFNLPIYIENVLGYSAFHTGLVFLSATITLFIFASLTGYLSSKIAIKWLILSGMILLFAGVLILDHYITIHATGYSLAPGLILFGMGFGLSSAQLNNIIISAAPIKIAGEASATSITMRQIGSAIGIAIIGSILASTLLTNVVSNIEANNEIPESYKPDILINLKKIDIESGSFNINTSLPESIQKSIISDIKLSITNAAKTTMNFVSYFILITVFLALLLPNKRKIKN